MRACLPLLLVACAASAETDCQPDGDAARVALNAVRARAQQCGQALWAAVPPLRADAMLAASTRRYALELAARDSVDHSGAAGTAGASLRVRLRESGYAMRLAGENLAGGPETVEEAFAQWLASQAHCENLMAAEFQDFGLACVNGPGRYQRYWVLHLAAPVRSSPDRSP